MRRFWPLIVLALGGLFWWGMQRPDMNALPSVLIGRPAPDFTLPVMFPYRASWGQSFQLSKHLGKKPVIVNIWASWCKPACYDEAPHLQAAWQKYQDRVLFIVIDAQDQEQDGLTFIRLFGLAFPQVFDPRGTVGVDYGMYGVPETLLINREDRVAGRHADPLDPAGFDKLIQKVL